MTAMSAFKNITARLRELRSEWVEGGHDAPTHDVPREATREAFREAVGAPPREALVDLDFHEQTPPTPTVAPTAPEPAPALPPPVSVGAYRLLATLPPSLARNVSDMVDHCGRLLAEADVQDREVVRDSRSKEKTAASRREVHDWTQFLWGALVARHATLLDAPGFVEHPAFERTAGPRALARDLVEHAREHHAKQLGAARTRPWKLDPEMYVAWDEVD